MVLASPPPLTQSRDGPGFWIPDEVIDRHAERVGHIGMFLYLMIARHAVQGDYPSMEELADMTGLTLGRVFKEVPRLYELGLLNGTDLMAIRLPELTTERILNDAEFD